MNSDLGRAVLVKYVNASTSEMVFTLDVFHRFDSVAYTPRQSTFNVCGTPLQQQAMACHWKALSVINQRNCVSILVSHDVSGAPTAAMPSSFVPTYSTLCLCVSSFINKGYLSCNQQYDYHSRISGCGSEDCSLICFF